jgi:outer membrane protein insertion porin family
VQGGDRKSSEGVVIFTGTRVSGSSSNQNRQFVRSSRSRSPQHPSRKFRACLSSAVLSATALLVAVGLLGAPANAQVSATPAFTAAPATPQVLCQTTVVGNRRIPKESILARLFSRPGDPYDPTVVERDFNSLWNTSYFEDVRIERVDEPTCIQLTVYVRERPTIREVNFKGNNAITVSDIMDRFKKEKVGVTVESQYDPTKVKRAEVVLQEMLGEHGHQFATIKTEIKTLPPAYIAITFNIKEGPTVKVGKIEFTGNTHLTARELRSAMHYSKPIGVPHSIFLENLFPRTFDASKLDDDAGLVRQEYRNKGYAKANTEEPESRIRNAGGINPFTLRPSTGKRADILIPIEEGDRYRLGGITFSNNKHFNNAKALRSVFQIKDGDYFNATLFGKGLEALKKAYGGQGYIQFVGTPVPRFDDAKHLIYLDIDCSEGKQFYVSRIEFSGNSITRDRVVRREILVEEGQVYNQQLVDLSLLRLNQLNYFDTLKAEQDVETRQNPDASPDFGTVDLLLKLHEKGKNSIGVNGGISGLSGSFIGLQYETNNFLGLGETLSVNANIGDLSRNLSLGFTEPYLRNKPVSLGVQVFSSKFDYNPAKSYSIANGQSANLTNAQQSLLTNYNQSSTGLTVSTGTALRTLFKRSGVARVGLSYSLSKSGITTFNDNTRNVFQTLAFRSGIAGQNQLEGIITSVLSPSFSFSTLDRAQGPHSGRDFNVAVAVAGIGGNTKYYQPTMSFRQFFPMKGLRISREGHNVLGMRMLFSHVAGYGGEVAPPFSRVYGGGENDVRGFDIRASAPYTFIPTRVLFNLTNPDGYGVAGGCVPRDPTLVSQGCVQIPLPIYRLSSIGADTSFTSNIEYRIPLFNQVTFALFTDFGLTGNLQPSQLRQSVLGADSFNSLLYGCPTFVNGACNGGVQIAPLSPVLKLVPGTNFVPRMSNGAEISFTLPIVNAPFRIYYAYNPLRLYKDLPQQLVTDPTTFRNFFPTTGAGQFSYQQALQFYGADYILREPRKTFRFTVSTTF